MKKTFPGWPKIVKTWRSTRPGLYTSVGSSSSCASSKYFCVLGRGVQCFKASSFGWVLCEALIVGEVSQHLNILQFITPNL